MNKFISILILIVLSPLGLHNSVLACGCGCADKSNNCGIAQDSQNEELKLERSFCGGTGYSSLENDQKTKVEYSNKLVHSGCGSYIDGGNKK